MYANVSCVTILQSSISASRGGSAARCARASPTTAGSNMAAAKVLPPESLRVLNEAPLIYNLNEP